MYSTELKQKLQGKSVIEVSEVYGISAQTLYIWKRASQGQSTLSDQSEAAEAYLFIEGACDHYRIVMPCRVLGVSRLGYYAWRSRRELMQAEAEADRQLLTRIRRVHAESRISYGGT